MVNKKILINAKFITCNSQYTASILPNYIEKNKVLILYPCPNIDNSVDNDRKNELQNKHGLENKKIILTVGRLVSRKGVLKVLKKMSRILKEVSNAYYVIIGDGPEYDKLKNYVNDNNLSESVKMISNCGDEELKLWYSLADLFVMHTDSYKNDIEGFGIVYLEAALYGVPSVASGSGGTKEAVIDNITGRLTKEDNIADKIISLLINDKKRLLLGEQAKKFVIDNFDYNKQIKKIIPYVQI